MQTIVRYSVQYKVADDKWYRAEEYKTLEEAEVKAKKLCATTDVRIMKRVSHCVAEFRSRGEKEPTGFSVYLTDNGPEIKGNISHD